VENDVGRSCQEITLSRMMSFDDRKDKKTTQRSRVFSEHGCVRMLAGPLAAGQHRFLDFNFLVSCQSTMLSSHFSLDNYTAYMHFHPAVG
jgi:hypothetical protein